MSRVVPYKSAWVDITVHDFLSEIDAPPTSMAYALVTCLDSSVDVAALVRHSDRNSPLACHGKTIGKGVLLRTSRLLSIERKTRLFFGFDEVWFFPQPVLRPKPDKLFIVGPHRLPPQLPKPLLNWMQKNGCSLGVGDGEGMNFIAKLQGIPAYLIEAFAESHDAKEDRAIA